MKKWEVTSYIEQRRRKQGHVIFSHIIEAKTRHEAKLKFIEKYPVWMICEVIANPK